jgi:hypothetical protein
VAAARIGELAALETDLEVSGPALWRRGWLVMSRNDDLVHSWAWGRHFRGVAERGTGDRAGTWHFLMQEKADLVSKIGLDFLP